MNTQNLIKGLIILEKYSEYPYSVHTEIGTICYNSLGDKPMEAKDIDKLYELGWHQEDTAFGEYNKAKFWRIPVHEMA